MNNLLKFGSVVLLASTIVGSAWARPPRNSQERRQQTRSEWQKLGYAGAALAVLGQFGRDKTLSYVGAAGGLYSLYRFNEDSKSLNRMKRSRANWYNNRYHYYDGDRYSRKTVTRNGRKYYTYVRDHHR